MAKDREVYLDAISSLWTLSHHSSEYRKDVLKEARRRMAQRISNECQAVSFDTLCRVLGSTMQPKSIWEDYRSPPSSP